MRAGPNNLVRALGVIVLIFFGRSQHHHPQPKQRILVPRTGFRHPIPGAGPCAGDDSRRSLGSSTRRSSDLASAR